MAYEKTMAAYQRNWEVGMAALKGAAELYSSWLGLFLPSSYTYTSHPSYKGALEQKVSPALSQKTLDDEVSESVLRPPLHIEA